MRLGTFKVNVVLTMISPPHERYMLLSARVENCGLVYWLELRLDRWYSGCHSPFHHNSCLVDVQRWLVAISRQCRDDRLDQRCNKIDEWL